MADLNEKAFEDLLVALCESSQPRPMHLLVTEAGIDWQAARMASGELTEADLRDANIPEDLIAEVKRRANG